MKINKPNAFALTVSMLVIAVYIFSLIIFHILNIKYFWIIATSTSFLLFLLSYFIYRFFLEKFIYEKIKLIYKIIHTFKTPFQKESTVFQNKDLLETAEVEVLKWTEERKNEIEQLKKSDSYRREFIGNVSHELKTPIFNIQGYILTLLDGGLDDPTINKEYLLRAEKNINRMVAIVEDLEVISHLESGELKMNVESFDIIALAKEVIETLEIKAKKKSIRIYFAESYEEPINVMADRERIRQVLVNLMDNSIKYNNENGNTKISFFDMDENILIEVTDNGIGIDVLNIHRIFERFYRVDKSRSREQGGSGLGLAIVKHMIEAHNQTINVRSTVGIGTTFAFTLKKQKTF